eukprot:2970679-Prorocentrum_lima.AAC.1
MTSSLVGSEMCIRDRAVCPFWGVHVARVGREFAVEFVAAVVLIPLRVVAVSYTHLTLPTICSV